MLDDYEGAETSDGFDVNDENLDATDTNFNLDAVATLNSDGSNAQPLFKDLMFRDVNDAPVVDLDGVYEENLLNNGGFEQNTGDGGVPIGWDVSGANTLPLVYDTDVVVPEHSGNDALDLGPSGIIGDNGGTLSQTVTLTAGTYQVVSTTALKVAERLLNSVGGLLVLQR